MKRTGVSEAVQNESIASAKGILQKLFALYFDAFVYNQIWEDPEVDIQALQITGDSRILTISSGGCNALNYLLQDPGSVTAVDLNRSHIFLLQLKLSAAQNLPGHYDFSRFFAYGQTGSAESLYLRYIAPSLSKEARDFWESNTLAGSLIYGSRIGFFRDRGLYDHSRNGYFLRFFHRLAHIIGCRPEAVLTASTPADSEREFVENIEPFFNNTFVKLAGKLPVTLFGLGIPPQQYEELTRDLKNDETIIDIYRKRVRKLACGFPVKENYFAWQALSRSYDTKDQRALPEYLKQDNFETLKANLHKLDAKIGSVTDEIIANPKHTFNSFVFLDAQDWMDRRQLNELWTAIAERGEPGSRIIFRTAGSASPLDARLDQDLLSLFSYEKEYSQELFKQDRASIYGGFHLYILK